MYKLGQCNILNKLSGDGVGIGDMEAKGCESEYFSGICKLYSHKLTLNTEIFLQLVGKYQIK